MASHFPAVIDEAMLRDFQTYELDPYAVLSYILRHEIVQFKLGLGVGKSASFDNLLKLKALYKFFKAVVYLAPQWSIIEERLPFKEPGFEPKWVALKGRPKDLCDDRNEMWERVESTQCFEYGRKSICGVCPKQIEGACSWSIPMKEKLRGNPELILATEAHLKAMPDFHMTIERMLDSNNKEQGLGRDDRPLLFVYDEAVFANTPNVVQMKRKEIKRFKLLLEDAYASGTFYEAPLDRWITSIKELLQAKDTEDLQEVKLIFPRELNKFAARLQQFGSERHPTTVYLAHTLQGLEWSEQNERWINEKGDVVFRCRPFLGHNILFLTGNMSPRYLEHRFQIGRVYSPFDGIKFLHSKSRFYNIRWGGGAKGKFHGNKKQILDFFALKIRQNILEDKTTVLVAGKDFKEEIGTYLKDYLAKLDVEVEVEWGNYENVQMKPNKIYIIHYWMIGRNEFSKADAVYCATSYYANPVHVEELVFDGEPRKQGQDKRLSIVRDEEGRRKVELSIEAPEVAPYLEHYLFEMELEHVFQAIGRARPFTTPTEVILIQNDDLKRYLGEDLVELKNIGAAYEHFKLERAEDMRRKIQARKLREELAKGKSKAAVARENMITPPTLYNWLKLLDHKNLP